MISSYPENPLLQDCDGHELARTTTKLNSLIVIPILTMFTFDHRE